MPNNWISFLAMALALVVSAGASAQERKAYKYVDEKGNVIYSQTPPPDGREAKKVDIAPAQGGRGGYATPGRDYVNPDRYSTYDRRQEILDQRARARSEQEKRREEIRQKRLAEMEAECVRNRGTDCTNPDVLRYQESQKIPRPYYPRARY